MANRKQVRKVARKQVRNLVKVSGLVAIETHAQMAALAKQAGTTIGSLIRYAVGLALAEIARNPDAAEALEPDARPETNRRVHRTKAA